MSRSSVRLDLQALLEDGLSGMDIEVTLGSASNETPAEGVWMWDPEESDLEFSLLAGAGTTMDDIWSFSLVIVSDRPGYGAADAESRVQAIADVCLDVILDNRNLDGNDEVLSMLPTSMRGPITGPTTEGALSAIHLTIEIHERTGP